MISLSGAEKFAYGDELAAALFLAQDLASVGLAGTARKIRERLPDKLLERGVDASSVLAVISYANNVLTTTRQDLTDRRLQRFMKGEI